MTTINHRARFCENNFLYDYDATKVDYSSYYSGNPFYNCTRRTRSKLWKFGGCFLIDSTNNTIYINDGANKTVTISKGKYNNSSELTVEIQTKLNAASSNWSVGYDLLGAHRFIITNSGSVTIRLSQQANAIWNTLGFLGTTDLTGTTFNANVQRNHTEEYVFIDLGMSQEVNFASLIGPLNQIFELSNQAVITISASNLITYNVPDLALSGYYSLVNPQINQTITCTDKGAMRFLDDYDNKIFRYWKIKIVDNQNPKGPNVGVGNIFLGNYTTIESSNFANGLSKVNNDPSGVSNSVNQTLYFDVKTKYTTFESMSISVMSRADRYTIEALYEKLGQTTPFYLSIDPTNAISDDLFEYTKFVVWQNQPSYQNVFRDIYSASMSFREVV